MPPSATASRGMPCSRRPGSPKPTRSRTRISGRPRNAVALGGIALVLTYSAYVAEVFRAGIESVHPSQVAAARSLGLSRAQTMRTVVLPQAVRRVIPPLLNDLVALQKDSGLISILGAIDAVRAEDR